MSPSSHAGVPKKESGPAVSALTARDDDVHHVQVGAAAKVGVAPSVRAEGDPCPVGRPGGLVVGHAAVGEAGRVPGRRVHEPQVRDAVECEARAVEHVVEPVNEAVVRRRRRIGAGRLVEPAAPEVEFARRLDRGRCRHQARPIGRPFEPVHAARQVGQPARFTAVERQEVDLEHVLAVLGILRAVRLLLDEQAPVR